MKSKNNLLLSALLMIAMAASAQNGPEIKSGAKAATSATTGAQQDLLSDYLQVAAKSVTSTNSGLQLKLNWFSLNSDPDKYGQSSYNRTGWQRNGEFVGFYGKKSWQAGFNLNVWNLRDTTRTTYEAAYGAIHDQESAIISTVIAGFKQKVLSGVKTSLINLITKLYLDGKAVNNLKEQIDQAIPGLLQPQPLYQQLVQVLQTELNNNISAHSGSTTLPSALQILAEQTASIATNQDIATLVSQYASGKLQGNPFASFITAQQLKDLEKSLDDEIKNNPLIKQMLGAATWPDTYQKLRAAYEKLVQYVARRPLLTFGYLFNHQIGTGMPYHQTGLTYLMSFGGPGSAHIGQLKASVTDTLGGSGFTRNIVAVQAGYNQVLIVKDKTSLAEISAAFEGDKATSGYIAKTTTSKFYLDAYVRARLPSTPWLKLDLKYDPKGGNVFGLLDFTYNFGQ